MTDAKAAELRECPWCGCQSLPVEGLPRISTSGWRVVCSKGHSDGAIYPTKSEAIAAWNTRAEDTHKAEIAAAFKRAGWACHHLRRAITSVGYDEGWDDALDIAEQHIAALISDDAKAALDQMLASSQLALEEAWRLGYEHKHYDCGDVDACARGECATLSKTPLKALDAVVRKAVLAERDRVKNIVMERVGDGELMAELLAAIREGGEDD